METPNLNYLWAGLIVEELTRSGVRLFVIAPGSRSAPLAVAAFQNRNASALIHFDERGAAYFALGCARAGSPAAVICTSGTAVANCWPAVAEACQSALPLVILSADRPPELQACGANQTMHQEGIFASFVRGQLNLPCPDKHIPVESLLAKVDDVLAKGLRSPGGPVHINCMYREPLAPVPVKKTWPRGYLAGLKEWKAGLRPFTVWERPERLLSSVQRTSLAATLSSARRGLILAGRLLTAREQKSAVQVANKLGWPVFADITSGCRRKEKCPAVIRYYDLLLRSDKFRSQCRPDVVLHLGDTFVSKGLQDHLRTLNPAYIHVSPRQEHRGLVNHVSRHYESDMGELIAQLEVADIHRGSGSFLEGLLAADAAVEQVLEKHFAKNRDLSELLIARLVDDNLDGAGFLMMGNSMPVRDMDMLGKNCSSDIIHANRGVSGIDGNIATAAGMCWSAQTGVVAILGDMAALHDINSLALLSKTPKPVILVIINNRGGGIFSFLPIAAYKEVLDACFSSSHDYDFRQAAAMFKIDYVQVTTGDRFQKALRFGLSQKRSRIIEVAVNREANIRAHKNCYSDVCKRLDDVL